MRNGGKNTVLKKINDEYVYITASVLSEMESLLCFPWMLIIIYVNLFIFIMDAYTLE